MNLLLKPALLALVACLPCASVFAGPAPVTSYPSAATSQQLYDELDYQRAVQAYIWGQPLVGLAAMEQGAKRLGVQPLELLVFDQGLQVNQKLQTGNDDVIYSISYFDLEDSGPLVIEIPAGAQMGVILDAWQRPVEDVGVIGPDQGKGGTYLILPPGYAAESAPQGYLTRQSQTRHGMLFLRAVRAPGESRERAVARLAQTNLYAYAQRAGKPTLRLRKLGLSDYDGLTPTGPGYFHLLARRVAEEKGNERDRVMLGMLASIGIESGKPFAPDARMRALLEKAERTARAMVVNLETNPRSARPPVFKGSHWLFSTGLRHYSQDWGPLTQVDERAALFRFGFSMQKVLDPEIKPVVGKGAVYATAYRDAEGAYLQGDTNYRVHVPTGVPTAGYWSVTAYDADSFHFVDAGLKRPSLSSLLDLQRNADGSVDLYMGPDEPAGLRSNWIQTPSDKGFLLLFRLFNPTQGFFDGQWRLGDAQRVSAP
jgi:hypothetical protein